ncbi:MAG TPA: transglutaminase-like domain-containing protein [Methylomirabilota bacterium]|nr:transglutaminase-like domain-containing protein [Methylomirabilota bacterium]
MQTLVISGSPVTLPPPQRDALISLLVDDDPAIYQFVRQKILSYGREGCAWLKPYTLSNDPVMRRRATEIITHLARREADERFLTFCLGRAEDLDLEEAVHRLAQTQYPELNSAAYAALYDCWASELRERLSGRSDPDQILGAINQYLFGELRFAGSDNYGYDPECCYLNRIVDRRVGNPIGLCAVYLFLARRLGLPVAGIGLPGHFICRYQSSTTEIYIDCFRKGIFLSKGDCIKYLLQANYGLADGHLLPVTPRRMLLRMCTNLHQTYGHLEMTEEAARVKRYLVALSK